MSRVKIKDIAKEISERIDDPKNSGIEIFVGLEHYDSGCVRITRFGSTKNLDSSVKKFKAGDILIARRNVYLKRAGIVNFDGVTSGDSIVIRANDETIKKLLPFVFNSEDFWSYATKHADGSMSTRLSPKTLMEYEIELPDIKKRNKITRIFWSLNDTTDSYKKIINLSDELIKSQYINKVISNKTFKLYKLGELFTITSGGTPSRSINAYWDNGNIKWAKISDLREMYLNDTEEKITESGLKNSSAKLYKKGTFLFSIFATLGMVSILNVESCTNQAIAGLEPKVKIDEDFMFITLKQLHDKVCEIGRGAAQNNINLSILKSLEIPIPPNDIRREFSYFVKQINVLKTNLQEKEKKVESIINQIYKETFYTGGSKYDKK